MNHRQAGNKMLSEVRSKVGCHKAALGDSGYRKVGSNTVIKKSTFQLYRYCISLSLVGLSDIYTKV